MAESHPIPDNESDRLRALGSYQIVDSAPEIAYDDLTQLAADLSHCPVAIINLVADKREWFKAKTGLPANATEEPRGSICSTTIVHNDLVVIPDLTKDPRFADEPVVVDEPHFRFYAGMPLINPEGYALGTLCVLDFNPRDLEFEQGEGLRVLARQVVAQLELRRRLIELDRARDELAEEKQRSDALLRNILPAAIAEELKGGGRVAPRFYDSATIMFTDFKHFTQFAEHTEPRILIDELDRYFSAFDEIVARHGLEKLKTIGDAYMCAGGLPMPNRTHATDAAQAALEILEFVTHQNDRRAKMRLAPWELRIGIHTGSVMAGVVGRDKYTYDIWGDAVNIASRMEANAETGRALLSRSTYERIKNQFDATPHGSIEAKHMGRLETFVLERRRAA